MEVTNFYNYGTMNQVEPGATQINNYYDGRKPGDNADAAPGELPEILKTEQAQTLLQRLMDADMLDENWQPLELSGTERALVARAVSERLEIADVWQVFGQLWNDKPETLRAYFNKAYGQKKSLDFQERLNKIFD